MNDRLVPGWILALAAGVVIAAGVLIAVAPRLTDMLAATPGPTQPGPSPVDPRTAPPDPSGVPSTRDPASVAPSSVVPSLRAGAGTITFGRGPGVDRCSVSDPFPAGPGPFATIGHDQVIFLSAILDHPVATGGKVGLAILSAGAPLNSVAETQDASTPSCWANRTQIGPLSPGSYVFVILSGTSEEATALLMVT